MRFSFLHWIFHVELDVKWWGLDFDFDEEGGNLWVGPLRVFYAVVDRL